MPNHDHRRSDETATAEVVELFGRKRDRLSKKFGAVHPTLRAQGAQSTLATVTPITARGQWRASGGA